MHYVLKPYMLYIMTELVRQSCQPKCCVHYVLLLSPIAGCCRWQMRNACAGQWTIWCNCILICILLHCICCQCSEQATKKSRVLTTEAVLIPPIYFYATRQMITCASALMSHVIQMLHFYNHMLDNLIYTYQDIEPFLKLNKYMQ